MLKEVHGNESVFRTQVMNGLNGLDPPHTTNSRSATILKEDSADRLTVGEKSEATRRQTDVCLRVEQTEKSVARLDRPWTCRADACAKINVTDSGSSAVGLKEGRKTTEDDSRPGRPTTPKTDENVEITGKLIPEVRRLSIRELDEITRINKECFRQILHEWFNMCKVCAKMLPKLLTPEQKESRMNICADILNNIDPDPGLLDTVIMCDECVEAVKGKATDVLN
ncbi:hypothetical protein NQ318_003663 [Aromia moschata]|uniref:Uncharacterized protein n=1 Tax=Aromia moschata TaxID=1265417 RepID=A0AAV8Y2E8_9CUCU|nr:hypothetical protein NQ318_003663 [Aromia moschata]